VERQGAFVSQWELVREITMLDSYVPHRILFGGL
jgi:hypothetical protein